MTGQGRAVVQIKSYRDLTIWQKAMVFVTAIYRSTKGFPAEEQYGLTSQLRRAAISLPSNLAEGYGRNSRPEFKRFLRIMAGSLFEIQTQLEIAHSLGYLKKDDFTNLLNQSREIDAMLASLIKSVEKPPRK